MLTERQMDQAAGFEERLRTQGQADIARSMLGVGSDTCSDCGDPLLPERRKAAPWATRCTDCQKMFEGQKKCRK